MDNAESGFTVADARRLARKAKRVSIFYWVGPQEWKKECFGLTPSMFLKSISHKDDDDRMPCRLHRFPDKPELTLMIGVEP